MLADGWLGSPDTWEELARELRRSGEFGLDTEFHNVDVAKQSCVGRARVHVWSVAWRTDRLDPRGFHRCRGFVLPGAALRCPALKEVLEDPSVGKAVHNESVDAHALRNEGVTLRGAVNTLGLVRWQMPGLINQRGRFSLKALMGSLLGREPVCSFKQLVSYERFVPVVTWKKVTHKRCLCGEDGCRKRSGLHEKYELYEDVEVVRERKEVGEYPLESIVEGHERWELLLRYAAEDAVAALQVAELARERLDPAPWPYGGERPVFSQAVEESVIEMEAVGFHVDVPWCVETAARATADEEAELVWLHRWYVANAPTHGPHRREDSDPIWSSPTQMVVLFDLLGFPRSPIWSKGRVKRGEVKLDHAALEWISENHEESRQMVGHLLHLKQIRSGKKYLVKLAGSGGKVHPICGPAGDEDDRSGAVTGRLGIKGELEAQQLPKPGEKDLYQVRRAIVA